MGIKSEESGAKNVNMGKSSVNVNADLPELSVYLHPVSMKLNDNR